MPLTVKELREALEGYDDDRIVVMSRDEEGNGFSPLYEIGTSSYVSDGGSYGEIGLEPEDLTDEMRAKGYSEEDVKEGQKAIVLWPT
jgi:hypothetical protein